MCMCSMLIKVLYISKDRIFVLLQVTQRSVILTNDIVSFVLRPHLHSCLYTDPVPNTVVLKPVAWSHPWLRVLHTVHF